jgi:DNA-binding protein YbaB
MLYEYSDYQADADLTRHVVERMERVSKLLDRLRAEWDAIAVQASGGDGDVVLSVDHKGQLMSLSLIDGCTQRYTHLGLEELINATLQQAVSTAAEEEVAVEEAIEAEVGPVAPGAQV